MRIINRAIIITLAALLTASCTTEYVDKAEGAKKPSSTTVNMTEQTQTYRGHVIYGHEVRSFRVCDSDELLWIFEPKATESNDFYLSSLYKRFAPLQPPYQTLFAVINAHPVPAPADGFGTDYSGAIKVYSVVYAGVEGPSCDKQWNSFQYQAFGNEPFWSVNVSANNMILTQLGSEALSWPKTTNTNITNAFTSIVSYTSREANKPSAELTITQEPCWDTMADAYYAYSAQLKIEKKTLLGCALQGKI